MMYRQTDDCSKKVTDRHHVLINIYSKVHCVRSKTCLSFNIMYFGILDFIDLSDECRFLS